MQTAEQIRQHLIDVQLAFSRVPGQAKAYVQDRMRACGEKAARLLADANTYVYVCGHKQMEQGVEAAFAEICGANWNALKQQLRSAGRYHVETY